MDSLRNLQSSLPRTPAPAAQQHELLSAFKAAALSVTNLYKTAASDQTRSKAEGYQQALDELLTFLDRENLGLGVDGEGWRIRRWATERYDGSGLGHSDDEDDKEELQQQSRHESPEVQRKQELQQQPQAPVEASVASAPEEEEDEVRVEAVPVPQLPSSDMFTFRSSYSYPSSNHDRDMDMESSSLSSGSPTATTTTTTSTNQPLSLPRQRADRHNRHNPRHGAGVRTTSNSSNLGNGAGSKRKVPDFFDISGFGGFGNGFGNNPGGKDFDRSGSGGKRGRHA